MEDYIAPTLIRSTDAVADVIYGLAASPEFLSDGICFAARQTGLYRSIDGGKSWHSSYVNSPSPITTVAASPGFDQDRTVFAGLPGAIVRSIDAGEHWSLIELPTPPSSISSIVISPQFVSDGIVCAGTMEDGVLRSTDRGLSWAAWNFGLIDFSVLCLAISPSFARDQTLLAGTESGVFTSKNGGRSWHELNFPPHFAPILSLALSPSFESDGIIFVGTESYGLFRSEDRGKSWQSLGAESIAGPINQIVLSPIGPHILVATSSTVCISQDDGNSWSEWREHLTDDSSITALFVPEPLSPNAPMLVGFADGTIRRID